MPDTDIADACGGVVGGVLNGGATESNVENGSTGKQQPLVPITYKTVTPHLFFQAPKAAEAIAFYKKAFGAEEVKKSFWPKRKADQEQLLVMHAQLRFGGTQIYLADETEDMGDKNTVKPPASLNGSSVLLHLETSDVDGAVARAVEAGGTLVVEVEDQFWGDRYGSIVDPFGYAWSFSTPVVKEAAALTDAPIEAGQAA